MTGMVFASRASANMRRWTFFALAGVMTAGPTLAEPAAQAVDPCVEGRQLRKHGRELYRQAEHQTDAARLATLSAALSELERSAALCSEPSVFAALGFTQAQLGHPHEAIDLLGRFLLDGKDAGGQAEALVLQLARDATIGLLQVDAPAGTSITVDGSDVGSAPLSLPLQLAAGEHELTARWPDTATLTKRFSISAGQRQTLSLAPPSPPPPAATPPPRTAPAPALRHAALAHERPPSRLKPTLGYVTAGLGVAVGLAALAHHVWNRNRYANWKSENHALQADHLAPDYAERQTKNNVLAQSVNDASRVTVGLAITGGALAVGGSTLMVLCQTTTNASASLRSTGFVNFEGTW